MEKVDNLILASDGLSDNLWNEVVRFRRELLVNSQEVDGLKTEDALNTTTEEVEAKTTLSLKRRRRDREAE